MSSKNVGGFANSVGGRQKKCRWFVGLKFLRLILYRGMDKYLITKDVLTYHQKLVLSQIAFGKPSYYYLTNRYGIRYSAQHKARQELIAGGYLTTDLTITGKGLIPIQTEHYQGYAYIKLKTLDGFGLKEIILYSFLYSSIAQGRDDFAKLYLCRVLGLNQSNYKAVDRCLIALAKAKLIGMVSGKVGIKFRLLNPDSIGGGLTWREELFCIDSYSGWSDYFAKYCTRIPWSLIANNLVDNAKVGKALDRVRVNHSRNGKQPDVSQFLFDTLKAEQLFKYQRAA